MGESVEQLHRIDQLEKWIEMHGSRLFLYAQQQTGSYADAQDVYQEALIKVIRSAQSNGEPLIPPIGRVFLAIKHGAIDLHRSRSVRENREGRFEMQTASEWFVEEIENNEKHQYLQSVVRNLPQDQQEVLVLKIWGTLTFKTISEILGVPLNTVTSRYRYALDKIKSSLNLQAI
jgi:RNA polymerase sigma-70 factor, ECF subfamily